MGCRKLTYGNEVDIPIFRDQEGETLEETTVFLSGRLEKNRLADKKWRDYYPYGSVAQEWINPPESFGIDDRYRFQYQGQFAEMDTTTGWNHFQLREYDGKIGRWLVPDPKRQYVSLYLSMGNNPINRWDPDGGDDNDITVNDAGEVTNVQITNDNFDRVLNESGTELFRTDVGDHFNINFMQVGLAQNGIAEFPKLVGIGIGTTGLTMEQLSRMVMLGANGKVYPSSYKGRGWNSVAKGNRLGGATKILSKAGLLVDAVLVMPTIVQAVRSGSATSPEAGEAYVGSGMLAVSYYFPALGVSISALTLSAQFPATQQIIQQTLDQKAARENANRMQFPSGPTYIGPTRNR